MVRFITLLFLLSSFPAFSQDTIPSRWEMSFSAGFSSPIGPYKKKVSDWGQPPFQLGFIQYDQLQKRGNAAAKSGNYYQVRVDRRFLKGFGFWSAYRFSNNGFDPSGFGQLLRDQRSSPLLPVTSLTITNPGSNNSILPFEFDGTTFRFIHDDYQIHHLLVGYSYTFGWDKQLSFSWKQGLGYGNLGNLDYEVIVPTRVPSKFVHQPSKKTASAVLMNFGASTRLRLGSQVLWSIDVDYMHGNFSYEQEIIYAPKNTKVLIDDSVNLRTLNIGSSLIFTW
ncbi:MAG: hypothetical protein Q8S14_09380 [Algoriphagus sp.]|uniref:hypothetical protein n=1 Tax=Algoriphagus sp. TaxID=1872435 RepID=UPI002730861C|nr:hypothetical protein [Algoriphagus sp.]MDP2042670.1 hypothetical protein [Algoriphagus sp.]MDP3472071.1 hypothetical protein [Algoriphagus sp.]